MTEQDATEELMRLAREASQIDSDIKALEDRKRSVFRDATAYASENLEVLTGLSVGSRLKRTVEKWSKAEWKAVSRTEACIITGARVTLFTSSKGETSVQVCPVGKRLKKNGEPSAFDADRWSLMRWKENGWQIAP